MISPADQHHSDTFRADSPGLDPPPIFYIVDWLPPDFGAVGQYASIACEQLAASGRNVHLIGLTHGAASYESRPFPVRGGVLTVHKLHAAPYEKTRLFRRLLWSLTTNMRLLREVLKNRDAGGADIVFTGSPPFMLHFAIALKYLRSARLTYRITDFYPEAIIAHLGRRPFVLALFQRLTWFLRRRVDQFEVLGEDQRALLLQGGIAPDRIVVKRDTTPVPVTGAERPAPKPPELAGLKVLLYSGNYGVAHEVETVEQGLILHHQSEKEVKFGLWLNATGQNADRLEHQLRRHGIPLARTPPADLNDLPSLLAAADAHLIALRPEFSGIVLPSKVYACIFSRRPIVFVGPTSSDVHLLCERAEQPYIQVTPGDAVGFAQALERLAKDEEPR